MKTTILLLIERIDDHLTGFVIAETTFVSMSEKLAGTLVSQIIGFSRDCARITLALYRMRAFRKKVRWGTVLRRAFDKAVRRKPPVVAADAGPMQIQWREGAVSRCTGAVRQSTTDDTGR
jgi:hypothetical protein